MIYQHPRNPSVSELERLQPVMTARSSAIGWRTLVQATAIAVAVLIAVDLPAGSAAAAEADASDMSDPVPADAADETAATTRLFELGVELGGGGFVLPSYEGSKNYIVGPYPAIRFRFLRLRNGWSLGGGDDKGFSVAPSFRIIGAREAADHPELTGLNDLDASFELGISASYTWEYARILGDLRYGVTGHNGFQGRFGADLVARPLENLTLTLGPRAGYADDAFMDYNFGVTRAESIASGFAAFDPAGGFKSVGIELGARYDFNVNWAIEGTAIYDRLIADAGRSPIVAAGSRDQFSGKIGVLRKFDFAY